MSDLFADLPPPEPRAPAAHSAPAPATPVARPSTWRQPGPREDACHGCHGAACYGDGRVHWCRSCVPRGFLPHTRGAA